jgi:hypothetical protein
MAITFRGTVKSYIQFGNDAITQNIFTIENGYKSRVNVNILRLLTTDDSIVALATVMPIIKTARASGISGGVILEKVPFDTLQTSDENTVFRAQIAETARINATPGDTVWQNYLLRMHTAVEQQVGEERNFLPLLTKNLNIKMVLHPGESLLSRVYASAAASNSINMHNYAVECVFEEDAISTFTIGGIVTLSGVPQADAKVMVIEADNVLLTNAFLREVITTPAGGTWSSTIRTGKVGAAFVQYKNGTIYYTAPGSPFLSS